MAASGSGAPNYAESMNLRLGMQSAQEGEPGSGGRLPGPSLTTVRERVTGACSDVRITVDIEEFDVQGRIAHAVADYVRALLKVRSLRRAVGESLLEAERCKQKLRTDQVAEAQKLFERAVESTPRPRLLRRSPKRPPSHDHD